MLAPYTVGDYLADDIRTGAISTDLPEFEKAEQEIRSRIDQLMANEGAQTVDSFHKRLGKIMWNECGMERSKEGLEQAIKDIQALRAEFWKDVRIPGSASSMNPELEKALRVADLLELGELMCLDALDRNESCGGHFRVEYQTEEGGAPTMPTSPMFPAWEYTGDPSKAKLNKEDLVYDHIEVKTRSYK